MKKMIISDLLQARSTLLLQVLICTGIGLFSGVATGSMLLTFAMPMGVFAFGHCIGMPLWDETDDWQSMRLAMPFSRRGIVSGRYVTALIFLAIGFACSLVALAVVALAGPSIFPASFDALPKEQLAAPELFYIVSALVSGMLLICAFLYAVSFLFGLGRIGRWIPVIVAVVVAVVVFLGGVVELDALVLQYLAEASPALVFSTLPVVAAVLFAASWAFSIKVYERREF